MSDQQSNCQLVGEGIWRVANQIHPSNTYLCATGEPGECFLVDPGTDGDAIDAALVDLGMKPKQIFCTHGHFDHIGSAAFFQEKYGSACFLHSGDQKTMRGSNFLMMAFKIPFVMKMPQTTALEGFASACGGRELRSIEAPGHTPGSCIIQYGNALFTGDTLYSLGIGLSKLPGGNSDQLKATLLKLWGAFPEAAQVFPGHGECGALATIKTENKPLLAFLGLDAGSGGGE
jgi:hydroxyacylglutathione hydrolase